MLKKITIILFLTPAILLGKAKLKKIEIHGSIVQLEVADTVFLRQRGLMYRKEMERLHGMLFIHDKEDNYSYWMKNCFIRLDMIFLNSKNSVVHIFHDVPPCREFFCRSYRTPVKAKYVIELNAGMAKKLGIRNGNKISF